MIPVSYLFRTSGCVIGLSVGSTIFQSALRYLLSLRLSGEDAQEVSKMFGNVMTVLDYGLKDCKTRQRIS